MTVNNSEYWKRCNKTTWNDALVLSEVLDQARVAGTRPTREMVAKARATVDAPHYAPRMRAVRNLVLDTDPRPYRLRQALTAFDIHVGREAYKDFDQSRGRYLAVDMTKTPYKREYEDEYVSEVPYEAPARAMDSGDRVISREFRNSVLRELHCRVSDRDFGIWYGMNCEGRSSRDVAGGTRVTYRQCQRIALYVQGVLETVVSELG